MSRLEPRVRTFAVTLLTLLAVPVATADAGFFGGDPIDGPGPDIVGHADVDVGRDGSGAVAYVKSEGAAPATWVSRMVNGQFQIPERLGAGDQPAVAAADGGRIVVAWSSNGTIFTTVRPGFTQPFTAPQAVGSGVAPSVDLSINGVGYLSFTSGTDVLVARMDRGTTNFQLLGAPADVNPGDVAGDGARRSKIAVSAEGTALVVFGEQVGDITQVIGRRVFGLNLSQAPQALNLPELEGRQGGSGDLPEVDIEDDASYAWVTFRQTFNDNGVFQQRAIARRLVGSLFEAPSLIDGLTWGDGQNVANTRIDLSGRGDGIAGTASSFGVFGAVLKDDAFFPGRGLAGGTQPQAVGGVGENLDRTLTWISNGPGESPTVRARFYDDRPDVRKEPAVSPEAVLSKPEFGPVDPAVGIDAAINRVGDAVAVWVQAGLDGRRLVAGTYDRPPGAFIGRNSTRFRSSVRPEFAWQPSLELWGPLTYTVEVDGQPVGQTQDVRLTPAMPIGDGLRKWRVVATDRRGQMMATPVRNLRIDSVGPNVTVTLRRSGGRVVRASIRAADVLPPSGKASGVKQVRIAWGDGTTTTIGRQRATVAHRYRRGGEVTVRVSATDKAGASTVVRRTVRPKR